MPIPRPASAPKLIGRSAAVAAAQVGEADRLDHQRLGDVGREVRGDLAEQRPDQEGEQCRGSRGSRPARRARRRADPDPRRDQRDPGGQHDQGGLEGERELRHAEVELAPGRSTSRPGRRRRGSSRGSGSRWGRARPAALRSSSPSTCSAQAPSTESEAPPISIRWVGPQRVTSWPKIRCQMSSRGKAASELAPQIAIISAPIGACQPGAISKEVRVGLFGRAMAEHPGEQHAEEPGEDEVVGGVGERAGVAALVDVQGDVPVHAEDGDQQGDAEEACRAARPSRAAS